MLVKKYSNRRLYDTEGSRYVTLEEIAERVRGGADVRVVDAKTNDDLTQATLAQIIIESRGAGRLLPTPLLVQLIRLGDDALAEFFGRYLSGALELYLQARQGAMAPPMSPFAFPNPYARLFGGGFWGEPAAAPAPAPAPAPASPPVDDVATLRRELEELKDSLRAGNKRKR